MSYAAHHKDFSSFVAHKVAPKGKAAENGIGVLRRIFETFTQSRQRDVDRQIARFLAQSGRAFTDDLEREISQRLLTSNWSVNAGAFNDRRFP
jgi:hypothetical protein